MNLRTAARFRILWVLALLVGSVGITLAQTISGTILDADTDEPLIGANILVVGTSTGTITDYDGNFELTLPDGAEELRVSYTGYAAQTIPVVAGQSTYNLTLGAGELLDEVVVIGYGSVTQGEVTSAVTTVKEEDFNAGVVNNPTQLVQGKVAGLQIATPGGDPNQQPTIRLRGLSTLGANVEPLIIIDGVIGADLSTVDPSDIASIDVLKDGSAAAIYGTRAASGVLIVTTKRARAGETSVTYRVQGGMEQLANGIDIASPEEYVRLRGTNDDGSINTDVVLSDERNDVYDQLTRNALSQIHNISVAGGTQTGSYRGSLNYRDVEGVANFSQFDQINARLNVRQKALDDMLTFDLTGSFTSRDADVGYASAFRYAAIYNPTIPLNPGANGVPDGPQRGYEVLGGFARVTQFDYFNPLAVNALNTNTFRTRDALLSGIVTFEPVDNLSFNAQYSFTTQNQRRDRFSQRTSDFPIGGANDSGLGRKGYGQRNNNEVTNNLFEATGTYQIEAGDALDVEVLAGYSYQDIQSRGSFIAAGDFLSDVVGTDNFGLASDFNNGRASVFSGGDNYEIESYFGRVKADFDDFIFVQASVRSDGSTRFGRDEKRGIFPAVSGGINLGRYVGSDDVNLVKLRAGYGVTGNLPGQSTLSQLLFTQGGAYPFNGAGNYIAAAAPFRSANSGLRFERKGELNVGLDLAFLDYRLTAAIDYFRRRTTDLIFQTEVPLGGVSPNGDPFFTNTIFANLDDVAFQNNGIELTLGYEVTNTDRFAYTPRVVLSTVKTTLEREESDNPVFRFFADETGTRFQEGTSPGAPGQNNAPTQIIRVGEEIGQIYTYVFDGVNDDGTFRFADLDNSGDVTIAEQESPDKQVVGNGLPDFTLGFANDFRFGAFDATLFFRGAFGHSLANMPRNFYENLAPTRGSDNVVVTEFFDPAIKESRFNSRYVEKADFVVLDNASVGYNVPLASDSRISNLRLSISGQRLFYITNYTGVDPEVRYSDNGQGIANANNILAPGIDRRNNYFRTRSFNLAANVTF